MTVTAVPGFGLFADIPEWEYHEDTLPPELGRSLSVSGAKTILRSPAQFVWDRQHGRPDKRTYDIGHAAHRFILGAGNDIHRVHASTWQTNAAKAEAKAARDADRVPLLVEDYRAALNMAKSVKRHPTFGPFFREGDAEVSAYWTDTTTGVTLRARFDWVHPRALIDVKTAVDASPDGFAKAVANYRYDMQAAHYTEGYEVLTGRTLPFVFVVVEKTPPHLCAAYVLPVDALERGARDNARARAKFAECESAGEWPGYSTEIQMLDMPAWFYRQERDT